MALSDEAVERLADAVKKLMETTQAPRPWYERFLGPAMTILGAVFAAYLAINVNLTKIRADLDALTSQMVRVVAQYDTIHRWQEEHMRDHVADRPRAQR